MFYRAGMVALVGATVLAVFAPAQDSSELEKNKGVGDNPDTAPAIATDLHPDLTHDAIRAAMRKVADWQLERATDVLKGVLLYSQRTPALSKVAAAK